MAMMSLNRFVYSLVCYASQITDSSIVFPLFCTFVVFILRVGVRARARACVCMPAVSLYTYHFSDSIVKQIPNHL